MKNGSRPPSLAGTAVAAAVAAAWGAHLWYALAYAPLDPAHPMLYIHVALQAWLFTGLFITAHDAMHGTVSPSAAVNTAAGRFCTFLYAGMRYDRLLRNHRLHHQRPGSEDDPDYTTGSQNFFAWWFRFMRSYLTIWQIVTMALVFQLVALVRGDSAALLYWALPAILSTFQLFYFGTFLPHRLPHTELMQPHRARSQRRGHLRAFLSCYFFGYHSEHHASPHVPWWRLYREKEEQAASA
jgi:beta-carotene ketolase (CrtW type)